MKNALNIVILITFAAFSFAAAAETTAKKQNVKATTVKKTDKKAVSSTKKKAEAKKPTAKTAKAVESAKKDEVVVVEEAQQKFVRKFEKWDLFKIIENSKKVCFITSPVESEKGTFKKRSNPYVLVTYRGRGTPEISISSGYNYKSNSFVEVSIDGEQKFDFFTSDKTPKVAWAKDAKADAEVINKMKKGTKLVVVGNSTADTNSVDTYSLKGFKAAFDGVVKFCK